MSFEALLAANAEAVEAELTRLLPSEAEDPGALSPALSHAALGGGKRLRPFLLMQSAALFDGDESQALRAAAAIEMLHCYSLVHDDLPAMDDSPLRRGKPTVHVAYNEATAILVGDALLTEAFSILAAEETHPDPAVRCDLVAGLAKAAGNAGMVGGQAIDLSPERHGLDLAGIEKLQALKTGALIREACRMGAVLGGAEEDKKAALDGYAWRLGLIFQITDDLLDLESDTAALGKPAQQDAQMQKATFAALLGPEAARLKAAELGKEALECLDLFAFKADFLRNAVDYVLQRRK